MVQHGVPNNTQPEPSSALFTGAGVVHSVEPLEDAVKVFRFDSLALVCDKDVQPAPVGGRDLRGVVGAPLVLGPEGWTRVLLDDLPDDEATRLLASADRIAAGIAATVAGAGA